MIGRDDVLPELSARLLSDRFVTLRGPGEIGKTTVATALAHDMWQAFEGHVHFLEFGPLKDATLVASTVAAALGLVVHHDDPSGSIVNFLRGRRLLLILDSCEHVIDEVASFGRNIYREAPDIAILATSRESLLVEGEQIFELVPLAGPPQGARLSAGEVLIIRPRSCSSIVPRPQAIAAISRTRMPTSWPRSAASSTASRSRSSSPPCASASTDCGRWPRCSTSRLKLEWRGRRTAPPRQQTLGATLDWSFGLIGESERTVLQRLAVFAGPFTLKGAIAVAADE